MEEGLAWNLPPKQSVAPISYRILSYPILSYHIIIPPHILSSFLLLSMRGLLELEPNILLSPSLEGGFSRITTL